MQIQTQERSILLILVTAGAVLASVPTASADVMYAAGTAAGPSGSTPALANSDGSVTSVGSWETWIGGANWVSSGNVQTTVVMGFQLPSLGALSNPFGTATLGVNYFGTDNSPTFNVDLYGLGVRDTSDVLGSDYYGGSLDTTPGVTLLHASIITPSTTPANADAPVNVFSSDIASYLNTLYDSGANAGKFVMFRFNADVTGLDAFSDVVYHLETSPGNGTPGDLPQINYTTVPEPSIVALFGLAAAALVFRKSARR